VGALCRPPITPNGTNPPAALAVPPPMLASRFLAALAVVVTLQRAPLAHADAPSAVHDASLVNAWLDHALATAQRRRFADRVLWPVLSGVVGTVALGLALSGELGGPADRAVLAGSALSFTGVGGALIDRPRARYWAGPGFALGGAGLGAGLLLAGYEADTDPHHAPTQRWLGGSMIAYGFGLGASLMLPQEPGVEEYRAAQQLPEAEREAALLSLMEREDHAERRVVWSVGGTQLVCAGIVLGGAASVNDAAAREGLLLSSLVYAVPALLVTVPALVRSSRVARFAAGVRPRLGGFSW
jgi:hypothetical protein